MAVSNSVVTLSYLGSILNKILLDQIQPVFERKAFMWKWFPKKHQEFGEVSGFQIPIESTWNRGIGASAENGNLPPLDYASPTNFVLPPKYIFGGLELTLQSTVGTKSKKAAIVQNVKMQMKDLQNSMIKDMNRVAFGDDGRLGVVASSSGSTLTMKTPDYDRYVYDGDSIAVHNGSGNIRSGYTFTVTDVNRTTHVVTVDADCSLSADGDYVYRALMGTDQSSQNNWPQGLDKIVDDGTYTSTSFQGKTRSASNPEWNGNVFDNGGGGRDLSTLLLNRAWDKIKEKTVYDAPDMIVLHPATKREYREMLIPDIRWTGGGTMDAGSNKLAYNGTPLEEDVDCQYGQIYFLRKKTLAWYEQAPLQFWDHNGVIQRMDSDTSNPKANMYARIFLFGNFGCSCPAANSRITDLNYTL